MEALRSEDWSSISYCCGWGLRESRGPNPLLQTQLRGLRMVPVPWLTSSKAYADVLIPPPPHLQHTDTRSNTSSNSLLTPQSKQSTRVTFLITRALPDSFESVSAVSHLPCSSSLRCLWSWEGSHLVLAVVWHHAMRGNMVTFHILLLVSAHFHKPKLRVLCIDMDREIVNYTSQWEINNTQSMLSSSEVCKGLKRLWPFLELWAVSWWK